MILIVIQNIMSALTVIVAKKALLYAAPIFYLGLRMFFAGAFLLGSNYFFGRPIILRKKDLLLFGQIIVIQLYMACLFDAYATRHLTSARVCLLYVLAPCIAAFFSYYFFNEKFTKKKFLGLGLGLLGFIPMLFLSKSHDSVGFISWAGIALFLAVIGNTYGYIIVRKLLMKGYSAMNVIIVALVGGGSLLLGTSLLLEGFPPASITSGWSFLRVLVISAITAHIAAYSLNCFLLKRYSVTFLAFAGAMYPVFGALFGWLFLDETITLNFLLAFSIIAIGLYIYHRDEHSIR